MSSYSLQATVPWATLWRKIKTRAKGKSNTTKLKRRWHREKGRWCCVLTQRLGSGSLLTEYSRWSQVASQVHRSLVWLNIFAEFPAVKCMCVWWIGEGERRVSYPNGVIGCMSLEHARNKEPEPAATLITAKDKQTFPLTHHSLCFWPPPCCRLVLTAYGAAAALTSCSPGCLFGWVTADKTIHRNYGRCFLLSSSGAEKIIQTIEQAVRAEALHSPNAPSRSLSLSKTAVFVSRCYHSYNPQRSRQVESGQTSMGCCVCQWKPCSSSKRQRWTQ